MLPRNKEEKFDKRSVSICCLKHGWWTWSWVPKPMRSVCKVSWFLGVLPFSNSDLIFALRGRPIKKDGESWSLPTVGVFFSALHMFLTFFSGYLVGRLNLARIQAEWRQGSPLVPRFAMTGATAIHGALALSAGCFAIRRRSISLSVICDAKRLMKRAKETLGNKVESDVGLLGRYSYMLFMAFCMAKAETALQMLIHTEYHAAPARPNNTSSSAGTTAFYDDLTSDTFNMTSEKPPVNVTSERQEVPSFLDDTEAFFSSFFQSRRSVPSWVQQAPYMWVQLASIAAEGQMTALCAVLRSSVATLNQRLVLLLGRRGRGLARAGGEDEAWREFPIERTWGQSQGEAESRKTMSCSSARAHDSLLRRGWSQLFKKRKRSKVAARRVTGTHFNGEQWKKTRGTDYGNLGAITTAVTATKPLSRELGDLRRLFGSMMDLHDGINRRFGDELLVNTIAGRLAAVLTLYAALYIIFDHRYRPNQRHTSGTENRNNYLTLYLFILFFQLLVYLSRLIYVCYACHRVCNAVARTRVLLQEFKGEIMDRNSLRELDIFSAQLESRNVEFSAGGFYAVDMKFLHSILGSLFTYLIILIQFQTP